MKPYTRDEIERILDSEKCRADDYETDRCRRHNGLMPLVGDSCSRRRSDLLAIIRQLLDQTDQLNALVGTVAEQARRELPEGWQSATEHGYGSMRNPDGTRAHVRRTVHIGPWEEA